MRELTPEELEEVAGGVQCTGFFQYLMTGTICCGPTLPENYMQCFQF
jgi:hypothetical protein